MADYTLTSDTLWSSISGTVDTDGDSVYLNGYTLTIDATVTPEVYFREEGYGNDGVVFDNQSNTIITVNCGSYYFFGDMNNSSLRSTGKLIDIGTVDANGQIDVSSVFPDDMPYPQAVYIPSEGLWLFNSKWYTSSSAADEAYSMNHQKPLFTYDDVAKTITFNYYPVAQGTVVQHENIVIHWRTWTDGVNGGQWYIGGNDNTMPVVDMDGSTLWGNYYMDQSLSGIDDTSKIRKISNCCIRTTGTGYKSYNNMTFTNCGIFEAGYSNGCLRMQRSQNNHWKDCTFYPMFRSNGGNTDNLFENLKFFGNGNSFNFFNEGTKFIGGKIVCGLAGTYLSGLKKNVIDGVIIEGIDDDAQSWTHKTYMSGYSAADMVFKNCEFTKAIRYSFTSNYYGYDFLGLVNCTLDSRGYPSNGDFAYPGLNNRIRMVNCKTLNDASSSSSWGRFSSGFNKSQDDWLIGYKGDHTGSLDSAWMLVLDYAPNANVDITDVGYYGDYFSTHYRRSNSQWEIRCNLRRLSFYGIKEISGTVSANNRLEFNSNGDTMTIDLTNGYNFMYYEIDTFGTPYYEDVYSPSNFTIEFSLDYGKTWFDQSQLSGKTAPKPFTMWMRLTHTRDGLDSFRFVNIPFTRKAGFTKYPNYVRYQTVKLQQLTHQNQMNCALYTDLEGYMGQAVSSGGIAEFKYLYHETEESYTIKCRKYGYEFNESTAVSAPEDDIPVYYTGLQKTDLTLTEAEAAAITGVVFQSSADAEYTWELDCGGGSVENAYHYAQYRLTNFGEWAGVNTFELDEFLIRDGDKFKTVQARAGEGVKLINYTGKVSGMTKDDGSVYVPPVDVIMTIDNIVVGSSVYIHTTDDDTEIFKGTADTNTVSATISGLNGKPYEVVIRKASSDPRYVEWTATGTIGTVDINITANQQEM